MAYDSSQENAFLYQLYTATNGEPESRASMYDIGAALGLSTEDAGEIAQDLCIKGHAELKTLSGGIGITRQGLKKLNVAPGPDAQLADLTLGKDPVVGSDGVCVVEEMLNLIKTAMAQAQQNYPDIEEMVIDMKTIEVQMLSPKPKTTVIKELFRSLAQCFKNCGPDDLNEKLVALVSS